MAPRLPSLSKQGFVFISNFSSFLANNDLKEQLKCLELHVFGSIAKGTSSPSDFDVAIVYRVSEYSAARSLRKWMRENSNSVEGAIGLRLNVLFFSHAEFYEARKKIGPTVVLPAVC